METSLRQAISKMVATNDMNQISRLIGREDLESQAYLLSHGALSAKALDLLFSMGLRELRHVVVSHPNIGPHIVKNLSRHGRSEEVSAFLLGRSPLRNEMWVLRELATSANRDVHYALALTRDLSKASEDVVAGVANEAVLKGFAANPTSTGEILAAIAVKSTHPEVLKAVIGNPHVPLVVLRHIIKTSDDSDVHDLASSKILELSGL